MRETSVKMVGRLATALLLSGLLLAVVANAQERSASREPSNSCVRCHAELDSVLAQPAKASIEDVHARHGYTCADCHGGDPEAQEPELAMSPAKGFVGVPDPMDVPKLCGKCHADVALMRVDKPGLRTDQLKLYWTSRHGTLLRKGDKSVAVCSSCHTAHGVLPPSDPRSSVHPTRVAATCGVCHSNAQLMARYGLPADQESEWRTSVHAAAMFEKNDLSAPTCNDCHGNHGALPPQVNSVSRVCGQCHVANDKYFRLSPHREAFAELGLGQCEVCHASHAVIPTLDTMLGVENDAVCGSCHEKGGAGYRAVLRIRRAIDSLRTGIANVALLLARVEKTGIPVDEADFSLREARNALVQSRTEIHKFSVEPVLNVVGSGLRKLAGPQRFGQDALQEIRKRRVGLLAFLAVGLVVVVGLVLTIRSNEG